MEGYLKLLLASLLIFQNFLVNALPDSSNTTMAARFNGACTACVTDKAKYQYCNATNICQVMGSSCPSNATMFTTIDQCGPHLNAKRYNYTVCGRNHIITSMDSDQAGLLEGQIRGGEYCQFLIYDQISDLRLKNTIANWQVNKNTTPNLTVLFYETNLTQTLNDDLTKNINLQDNYTTPLTPVTKMLSKFSHVIMIYNPTKSN